MSLSKDLFVNIGIVVALLAAVYGIFSAIIASVRFRKIKQNGLANSILAITVVTPLVAAACLAVPLEETSLWYWGMGMFIIAFWCIGGGFMALYFKDEMKHFTVDAHSPKYRDKYYIIGQEKENVKKRRLGWLSVAIGVVMWLCGALRGGYFPNSQGIDLALLGLAILFIASGVGEVIRGYHIK